MTEEEKAAAAAVAAAALEAENAAAAAAAEEAAAAAAAALVIANLSHEDAKAEITRLGEVAAAAIAEATAAKKAADRFKGIDPDVAKANAKKVSDAEEAARVSERAQAEAEGNFERLREIQNEEFQAQIAEERALRVASDEAATKAVQALTSAQLRSSFATSKFFSDETILGAGKAERLYADYVDVKDGVPIVYDAPRGAAKRTMFMDGKGNPLPFEAGIKKVFDADPDKDTFLKSKVKPGNSSKTEDGKSAQTGGDRISRLAKAVAELRK